MADQVKKILLEVSMKEQDATLAKAAALRKEIDNLSETQKKYLDIQKEKGYLNEKEAIEVERIKSQISNLTKEYREVQRVASAYNQVQTREIGSYKQLNALIQIEETKLKNLQGTLERNADGQVMLTDEYLAQKQAVEELNAVRIQFDQGIKVGRTNVGNYAGSILEATERIKQLDDFIMNSGVDMGSKEFKEAKDEADKLKLSIDQALGKVDEFGNREPRNPAKKTFDDAFESTVALSGAIGILTSLFQNNENAQENLARAMQAVAFAQSAANILKAKGAILDTADKILTGARTAVLWLWTNAARGATVAQRALNLAVNSFVVVAIVTGIISAIQWIRNLRNETNAAAESTDEMIDKLQLAGDLLNSQNEVQKEKIKILEAQGASERKLNEEKKKLVESEISYLEGLRNVYREGSENYDIYTKLIKEKTIELTRLETDYTKILESESEKRNQIQKEEFDRLKDIEFQNQELRIKTQTDGFREELLLFDLQSKKRYEDAKIAGLDLNLVETDIMQQRQQMIDDYYAEVGSMLIEYKIASEDVESAVTAKFEADLKKREELFKKSQEEKKQLLTEEFEFTKEFLTSIGQAFADNITETGFQIEQFARDLVTLLLDVLEKQITMAIAKTITDAIAASVLTPIKLLEAAGKIALITAAFESAKAVINKPPKFEQGGAIDIGGKRHAEGGTKFIGSDGTQFEAEAGEKLFIVNRRASSFLDQIGAINNAFRSKSFYSRPNYLADGGFVQRRLSEGNISAIEIERAMLNAVMKLPPSKLIISELKEKIDSAEKSITASEL